MAVDDSLTTTSQSDTPCSLTSVDQPIKSELETAIVGRESLNPTQQGLIGQAVKRSQELSFRGLLFHLPMGTGKSRISLMLGLTLYRQFLIIASKTLITNFLEEIHKIWPNEVDRPKYQVVHRDYLGSGIDNWQPDLDTRIILTTPQVIMSSYQTSQIERYYVGVTTNQSNRKIITYHLPTRRPFRSCLSQGISLFHGTRWEGIFVDEAQNYSNIQTATCRAIASLSTSHR